MRYYDYKCDKCEHVWEQLVDTSEERPLCPECGNKEVTRQVCAAAGYHSAANGTSVRSKSSGCFRGRRSFLKK